MRPLLLAGWRPTRKLTSHREDVMERRWTTLLRPRVLLCGKLATNTEMVSNLSGTRDKSRKKIAGPIGVLWGGGDKGALPPQIFFYLRRVFLEGLLSWKGAKRKLGESGGKGSSILRTAQTNLLPLGSFVKFPIPIADFNPPPLSSHAYGGPHYKQYLYL